MDPLGKTQPDDPLGNLSGCPEETEGDFDKSPEFWLDGPAGAGKSTTTQTTTEQGFTDGAPKARFFRPRGAGNHRDPHPTPMPALQLVQKYPAFRHSLISHPQSNLDIIHDSSQGATSRMVLKESRPSLRLEHSPQCVPDCIQEPPDVGGSINIRESIVRWRNRVPKRWDLLDTGANSTCNSTQEGEVNKDRH